MVLLPKVYDWFTVDSSLSRARRTSGERTSATRRHSNLPLRSGTFVSELYPGDADVLRRYGMLRGNNSMSGLGKGEATYCVPAALIICALLILISLGA
nr:hypothetical protein BgiMline_028568 [Biomphalaria glabrata]